MSEKKLGRNDPCWCGSQKKYKHCHMEMDEQIDRFRREGHTVPTRQMIKTPEQIEGSARAAASTSRCWIWWLRKSTKG